MDAKDAPQGVVIASEFATNVWGRVGDDSARKSKSWNYGVQRIRCRIEKIFGAWKRGYGFAMNAMVRPGESDASGAYHCNRIQL